VPWMDTASYKSKLSILSRCLHGFRHGFRVSGLLFCLMTFFFIVSGLSCKSTPGSSIAKTVGDESQFGTFSLLADPVLGEQLQGPPKDGVKKLEDFNLSTYSEEVFRSSKILDAYGREILENDPNIFEKKEAFFFEKDMNPFKAEIAGKRFLFPFSMKKNSAVYVRRVFPTAQSLRDAPSYSILDLPINLENADKMHVGDYVAIPVSMSVMANADGQFLKGAYLKSGFFKSLLSLSSSGSYSSLVQGKIRGSGDFTIHFLKLSPQTIRVRVTSRNALDFSAGITMKTGGSVEYQFIPGSPLEKMRDLKEFLRPTTDKNDLSDFGGKSQQVLSSLSDNQKQLSLVPELSDTPHLLKDLNVLQKRVDPFIENYQQNRESIDGLNERILAKAAEAKRNLDGKLVGKFYEGAKKLLKYRTHGFDLAGSVHLGIEGSKMLSSVGDYVFHLDGPDAREAYLHAVSGRAQLIGQTLDQFCGSSGGFAQGNQACSDFTLADYLAEEDRTSKNKRVEKIGAISTKTQSAGSNLTFGFLNTNLGFSQSQRKNEIIVEASDGRKAVVEANAWRFQRQAFVIGRADNEMKTTGFFTSPDNTVLGSYFYTWNYQKSNQSSALTVPLRHAINVLGSEFFRSSSDDYWPIDFEGDVQVRFQVIVNQNGLTRFFNPSLVSDDQLWMALGRMAETYDNTFGLPFNTFGALPNGSQTPAAIAACEKISKHWGAFYCQYFADRFLPKRQHLMSKTPSEKIGLFSDFFKEGFLANKIGADLMMRLVLEALQMSRKDDAASEYMLSIQVSPSLISNSYHSMDYEFGSDPLLPIARNLGLDMLFQRQ